MANPRLAAFINDKLKKEFKKLNYLEKYNFWLKNKHFSAVFIKTSSLAPEACAVKLVWAPIG
jgi:hypothetical protein